MPEVITISRRRPRPESAPGRIRWTRKQCEAMRENEVLTGRYELIEGEIISKMGQNRSHAISVMLLTAWLIAVFGDRYVQCQLPIDVADADNNLNEPEPDCAALAEPVTTYTTRNPGPKDLLLVVEISDTTLRFDLRTKAALYARASIPKYWVVDISGRRIIAHRTPAPQGYQEVIAYTADEMIMTLARPDAPVLVADLLPPV